MTRREEMMTSADWVPRRVLVTGYYDGPTEGIIDFGDEFGVFCFKEAAFDNEREVRVLKLARVAPEPFEAIIGALRSNLGPPKWPFWVPMWKFSDENARLAIESELNAYCATGKLMLAVLTDDALGKCFAVRTIDEQVRATASDWLSLFE
jgi:hypothetical protein